MTALDPRRRLAKAVATSSRPPDTSLRSAIVLAVYTDTGTADIGITSETDGTMVTVPGVRYQVGATPTVGNQVSFMMNGHEPYILSETGDVHDPNFAGRVTAESFHAIEGPNLLAPILGSFPAWEGWSATGTTISIDSSGYLVTPAIVLNTAVTITSPEVQIPADSRYYTGYIKLKDNTGTTPAEDRAYVWLTYYDASGASLGTWGNLHDHDVTKPGSDLRRYPTFGNTAATPGANFKVPATARSLRISVSIDSGAASSAGLTIMEAYIGTANVLEGGAFISDRVVIDQSGLQIDDIDLLSPWDLISYTNRSSLAGGTWNVYYKKMGKFVYFRGSGVFGSGAQAFGPPTNLTLPYKSAGTAMFAGYLYDQIDGNGNTIFYPITGQVIANSTAIRRMIHGAPTLNYGWVTNNIPFTFAAGDEINLSGIYEAV